MSQLITRGLLSSQMVTRGYFGRLFTFIPLERLTISGAVTMRWEISGEVTTHRTIKGGVTMRKTISGRVI